MPQRFLKPGILTSLRLARCSVWAQLLYYKLINLVDDYARYDAHPTIVARAAFPYGDPNGKNVRDDQVEAWMAELETARLGERDEPVMTRYTVNGCKFLMLHRWEDRRRCRSRFPSPESDNTCWQMLSDAAKCQQLSASPAPAPAPAPAPQRNGIALDLKTQYAACEGRRKELEAISEDERTAEERSDLKKTRVLLRLIQKKQAAGDFSPVEANQGHE